jgi:hypothetical protein
MDNPAQVRPEPALISAVVAAALALAAMALAVAVQRRAGRLRWRLRAGSSQSSAVSERLARRLEEARTELNRVQGTVVLASAQIEGVDARIDDWMEGLTRARVTATQLNEGRLVPVTQLIGAVKIALQVAGLWRNPFG